jgi:hypothetical protein
MVSNLTIICGDRSNVSIIYIEDIMKILCHKYENILINV